MPSEFDIAIVGSGFGGSLLAMIARRLGRSVVMIERGQHPRFAIGESSTPLANLLLEELSQRYELPAVGALSKWGSWQKTRPELACGLKRGFTFYHHTAGHRWQDDDARRRQLLVAASPHDEISDTHWYRPDFDHFLVRQAQELGTEYFDETNLAKAEFSDAGAVLSGERAGGKLEVRARFVVDATGPRGFLHRALGLGENPLSTMPETQALYSHFEGVRRWDTLHVNDEMPPYPVDDAAMHHVFDGGWIWVLRFNNGITSAGVAAVDGVAEDLRFSDGSAAWDRLLERLPSVREQFAGARASEPFVHLKRIAFRSSRVAGASWVQLPSAAGFVDPLLSTGFPLTLLGIERLAGALESDWGTPRFAVRLAAYERQTFAELDAAANLVGGLYGAMHDFELFSGLTFLYFAAAMHAETRRRLGQVSSGFLACEDERFMVAMHRCVDGARAAKDPKSKREVLEAIRKTIVPMNLAGLGDPVRRNWYPCRADDLLAAAPKLGVGRTEIERLLARCGFAEG